MAVGHAITPGEFDRVVGSLCRTMEALALQVEDTKAVLDTKNAATWAADLGKDVDDINTALSAMNDLAAVVNAYQGEAALTQADRRTFVRRVRGLSSLV